MNLYYLKYSTDNIIITDGYAFELDRSVPKIGEYKGKESELIFPILQVTTSILDDYSTATITINAQESTNGISKIEIIQGGFVLKEYTYENKTEEITENFEVKQNGTYVVKAYSKLTVKDKAEVNGLVSNVEYSPNGDKTYKKEHKVKVSVTDASEKVKNIKYQWLQTTVEPAGNTFTEDCNNGDTITKNEITGIWYLWTLLETESGKTNIGRSEAFNFDNQEPTIENINSEAMSETSFKLNVTALDSESGIVKYEFFVNETLAETRMIDEVKTRDIQELTVNSEKYNNDCYVIVTDKVGNRIRKDVNARTLGNPPILTETVLKSKSVGGINVNATATDADNDELTYKLYLGESSTALTLAYTSAKTEQGLKTELSKSYLSEYTTYYYRVDVTDGIHTASSNVYSVKTMCSGATSTCNLARKCSTCSGSGNETCDSSKKETVYGSYSYTCSNCNKTVETNSYTANKCSKCGQVRHTYYTCLTCGWNIRRSGATGSGKHKCSKCNRTWRNKMFPWIFKFSWLLYTW